MKRYRLVGNSEGVAKTFLLYAHSNLDAGARWKHNPAWYGIAELEYIEEISQGERRYYAKKKYGNRTKASSVRQARVRVDFSF